MRILIIGKDGQLGRSIQSLVVELSRAMTLFLLAEKSWI